MKIGVVARADDGGLGVMLSEAWRHLQPDRTLIVRVPGQERAGKVARPERFGEGATVVSWDGTLPEREVRAWLRGLDVVYCAETGYSTVFFDWCRAERVRSVLHVMPEYSHFTTGRESAPDVVWLPTAWLSDRFPASRLVPVPIALDQFPEPTTAGDGVIFPAGRKAAYDRAGERALWSALGRVKRPHRIVYASHEGRRPLGRLPAHVIVEYPEARANYWDGWDATGICVMPRRYGGLSLALNEAAAAGLALVVPASSPHHEWPGEHVRAREGRSVVTTAQLKVPTFDVNPLVLAVTLDRLVDEPDRVRELQTQSRAWAEARSWANLLPVYRDELTRACG